MVNHHHHQQQQQQQRSNMMVCCLCGDVGFPDKLFSCKRCCSRYQHSYCSNYNGESWEEICDWCVQTSEGHGGGRGAGGCSRRLPAAVASRSQYSGERIKRDEVVVVSPRSGGGGGGRSHGGGGGVPSPRQSTRRYKLLKDVMC